MRLFNYFSIVPSFAVSVQTYPSGVMLYEETYIDLICDHNIPEAVDTGVDIFFTWIGLKSNGESIAIEAADYTTTDQFYNSTLHIRKLSISRDNMAKYSCLVSATLSSGSVYIDRCEPSVGDLTLTVSGKLHTNENLFKSLTKVSWLVILNCRYNFIALLSKLCHFVSKISPSCLLLQKNLHFLLFVCVQLI